MIQKLNEKYKDMNINQYEALDILWKKIDEIIDLCNCMEAEINKFKPNS